ncbi:MAG: CDP-alcohol phosphatidyltransferase family protein [Clostridia bacterium]|nr:CDP-alcohol phosphatidyltransferase family protein [Clostridia bacterium]
MYLKRHFPNFITSLRIMLAPVLVLCILENTLILALCFFAVIFMSDLVDGALARVLDVCSKFGAKFDVIADFIYVMSALLVLNITGLASFWITVFVFMKFAEFAATSSLLKRYKYTSETWVFDLLGRIFALLVMLAPGVFCFVSYYPAFMIGGVFFKVAVYTSGILSSLARIGLCIKTANRKIQSEWSL